MIKFFRQIRQKLLSENKFSKYLLYAIGEIVLVVVGILIALQINNWNEDQEKKVQLRTYRQNLTVELESDLKQLEGIALNMQNDENTIQDYLQYYNADDSEPTVLVQKMDALNYRTPNFTSVCYTIEEIISTGNLSLFSDQEKNAILKLKAVQSEMEKYRAANLEDLQRIQSTITNETDLLYFYQYTKKQHKAVANWKYKQDSRQFRLFNNEIAGVLYFYENLKRNHKIIEDQTHVLMKILQSQNND